MPAVQASRLAVPHMRRQGGGAIVMVASIWGREAGGLIAYNATKAALMDVYLLDGTYELFRHFFAVPKRQDVDGNECGALIGVLGSVLGMFEGGCAEMRPSLV